MGQIVRYFCLIILIGGRPLLVDAQSLKEIKSRFKLLENPHMFKHDTSDFFLLPKVVYRCANGNKVKSDYYHVEDLNDDGKKDLVYSGPCSGLNQTAIFLNTGRGYKKFYDFPGTLLSIEKVASGKVINILKEAGKCEFYSQYTQLTINSKSEVTKNTIVFSPKTKITVSNNLLNEKIVGTLRTTPQINDAVERDACNNKTKGNQLTRIHEFKDVIQLSKSGPWWLVFYPENNQRGWIGWIKLN